MESRSWYEQQKLLDRVAADHPLAKALNADAKEEPARDVQPEAGINRADRRALAAQQRRKAKRAKVVA